MLATHFDDERLSVRLQLVTLQWTDVVHAILEIFDEGSRCQTMQNLKDAKSTIIFFSFLIGLARVKDALIPISLMI